MTNGGWDCNFEVCPMAYCDLAVRMQRAGCKFILQNEIMFKCSHTPGVAGDHGPIYYAQVTHDEPLYKSIYNNPDCGNRIFIDINNYKNIPDIWQRRFGNVTS